MEVVQWFLTSWWRSAQRWVSLQYRSKISSVIFFWGGGGDGVALESEEEAELPLFSPLACSIGSLSGEPRCSSPGRDVGVAGAERSV